MILKWFKYIEFFTLKNSGFELLKAGGVLNDKALFSMIHENDVLTIEFFYFSLLKTVKLKRKWAFDLMRFLLLLFLCVLYKYDIIDQHTLVLYTSFFVSMIFFTDVKKREGA